MRKAHLAPSLVSLPLTRVAPETTIALFADPEEHVMGPLGESAS